MFRVQNSEPAINFWVGVLCSVRTFDFIIDNGICLLSLYHWQRYVSVVFVLLTTVFGHLGVTLCGSRGGQIQEVTNPTRAWKKQDTCPLESFRLFAGVLRAWSVSYFQQHETETEHNTRVNNLNDSGSVIVITLRVHNCFTAHPLKKNSNDNNNRSLLGVPIQ